MAIVAYAGALGLAFATAIGLYYTLRAAKVI